MKDYDLQIPYSCSKYFMSVFEERVGLKLTRELKAEILGRCTIGKPHRKRKKGQYSEYFTMRLHGVHITIVADGNTHKLITVVIETRNRGKEC
jgi:hypothetical protein